MRHKVYLDRLIFLMQCLVTILKMPARLLKGLETVAHALTPISVFRPEAVLEQFDPLLRIAQLVHVILDFLVCFF